MAADRGDARDPGGGHGPAGDLERAVTAVVTACRVSVGAVTHALGELADALVASSQPVRAQAEALHAALSGLARELAAALRACSPGGDR